MKTKTLDTTSSKLCFSDLVRQAKAHSVRVEAGESPDMAVLSLTHLKMLLDAVERVHKPRTLLDLGRSPTSQAAAGVDFKPVRGKLVLRDMDLGMG